MAPRVWILLGGLLVASGIGVSAYHAHGLEPRLEKHGLDASQMQKVMGKFESAFRIQMYQGMGLVVVGLLTLVAPSVCFNLAGVLMFLGTLAFSGTLYYLVLAGERIPYLAPIGGTTMIVGWV